MNFQEFINKVNELERNCWRLGIDLNTINVQNCVYAGKDIGQIFSKQETMTLGIDADENNIIINSVVEQQGIDLIEETMKDIIFNKGVEAFENIKPIPITRKSIKCPICGCTVMLDDSCKNKCCEYITVYDIERKTETSEVLYLYNDGNVYGVNVIDDIMDFSKIFVSVVNDVGIEERITLPGNTGTALIRELRDIHNSKVGYQSV